MPTSSTAVAGRASVAASGSQVCTGHIGALTAKAMKNPTNIQRSAVVDASRFPVRLVMRKPSSPPGPAK